MAADSIDTAHSRPVGAPDELVAATGALSEALERIERARGALYEFHQLVGGADAMLDDVVAGLRATGHTDLADRVQDEIIGRNVIEGRWTFQLVEEFDDGYYTAFRDLERTVRETTMGGASPRVRGRDEATPTDPSVSWSAKMSSTRRPELSKFRDAVRSMTIREQCFAAIASCRVGAAAMSTSPETAIDAVSSATVVVSSIPDILCSLHRVENLAGHRRHVHSGWR